MEVCDCANRVAYMENSHICTGGEGPESGVVAEVVRGVEKGGALLKELGVSVDVIQDRHKGV